MSEISQHYHGSVLGKVEEGVFGESHSYHKGSSSALQMSVGDVIIVHNENQLRGFWKLGRIEETLTGPDGEIRGAVLRVSCQGGKTTLLRCPVQRLYPLEVPTRPIELSDSRQGMVTTPEPPDVTQCPD